MRFHRKEHLKNCPNLFLILFSDPQLLTQLKDPLSCQIKNTLEKHIEGLEEGGLLVHGGVVCHFFYNLDNRGVVVPRCFRSDPDFKLSEVHHQSSGHCWVELYETVQDSPEIKRF